MRGHDSGNLPGNLNRGFQREWGLPLLAVQLGSTTRGTRPWLTSSPRTRSSDAPSASEKEGARPPRSVAGAGARYHRPTLASVLFDGQDMTERTGGEPRSGVEANLREKRTAPLFRSDLGRGLESLEMSMAQRMSGRCVSPSWRSPSRAFASSGELSGMRCRTPASRASPAVQTSAPP